jgi:hypothetical protein
MKAEPPPKKYALACWWLTYRVPVESEIIPALIEEAAKRARMDDATFAMCRAQWPKAWERMLAKRAVRLAFLREHGEDPPEGWAPLPGDGRSRNVPVLAQKRRAPALVDQPMPDSRPRVSVESEVGRRISTLLNVGAIQLFREWSAVAAYYAALFLHFRHRHHGHRFIRPKGAISILLIPLRGKHL